MDQPRQCNSDINTCRLYLMVGTHSQTYLLNGWSNRGYPHAWQQRFICQCHCTYSLDLPDSLRTVKWISVHAASISGVPARILQWFNCCGLRWYYGLMTVRVTVPCPAHAHTRSSSPPNVLFFFPRKVGCMNQ